MKYFSVSLLWIFLIAVPTNTVSATTPDAGVVIYQLQTGGPILASEEFVSIYNNSENPIDISGWCLNYVSASGSTTSQLNCVPEASLTSTKINPFGTMTFATEEFTVTQNNFTADLKFSPKISATGGHIKLLDKSKNLVDTLGWGTAIEPEAAAAVVPPKPHILQRKILHDKLLQDTDNNLGDFHAVNFTSYPSGIYTEQISDDAKRIVITEILPNPSGADSGNEFIEIYNPNDESVNIAGYQIKLLQDNSKPIYLPELELGPYGYVALKDSQTGLVLPNTGARLVLMTPVGTELEEIPPYDELSDDVSWVLLNENWIQSFQPTPGAPNIHLSEKPCAAGLTRSETTGYCRAPIMASSSNLPVPCKPDQSRNADTGRCRANSIVSQTAACKVGQVRNIETNRCRNIASSSTAPQACPAGQERNADTKRCRKVVIGGSKTSLDKVKDVKSALVKNNFRWWIAGASALAALGYMGYEWRTELLRTLQRLKSKIKFEKIALNHKP